MSPYALRKLMETKRGSALCVQLTGYRYGDWKPDILNLLKSNQWWEREGF